MGQSVFEKVICILFVLMALFAGVFVVVLDVDRLRDLGWIMRFFNGMLPILAVGALLKYLLSHKS